MTVYFLDPGKEMPTGHGSLKTPGGQVRALGGEGARADLRLCTRR